MTYIEFFDKIASENVAACLTYTPDRVIYIGDNGKLMEKHIENYRRMFENRGYSIDFKYKTVSKSNLDSSVKVLSEIVEAYDDCVFDITGGEEILILALGIVYSKYPDKNIQIHRINLMNNTVADCDNDGVTIFYNTPELTVEENVIIYGGDVVYGGIGEEKTYKWDLNEEFLCDVELIWNICKTNVRYWNMQIGVFEAVESVGSVLEDGLTFTASRYDLDRYLSKRGAKYKKAKGIISYLIKNGLITCFDDEDDVTVTVGYKNEQVRKCLTKAGQALEMKVFTVARALSEKNGTPVYNDALNGVVIDWDGTFHDEDAENIYDTENEIDVLLMHGTVPVFISCKNGVVTSDELYKLDTVARRFGGRYSKKILIATSVDCQGPEKGNYLRQRAKDMGIRLVEDIQNMSDSELARRFKNFWSN